MAQPAIQIEASLFDYSASAELFPARRRKIGRRKIGLRSVGYRRFVHASEAIRFAIEGLAPELLLGAFLEVNEMRFDENGIRRLYDSAAYPLPRQIPTQST